MAGKALAAFCFFVVFLQVRAQVDCYPTSECTGIVTSFATALECCLQSEDSVQSYSSPGAPGTCQPCFVVGFEHNYDEIRENIGARQEVTLRTYPEQLPGDLQIGTISFTVAVSLEHSNAILGDDFTLEDFTDGSTTVSGFLFQNIPYTIAYAIVNDVEPGEEEQFVLELSNVQFTDSNGMSLEVLVVNSSLTVVIEDNDVIEVQFKESEFSLDEALIKREIELTITNPIIVDTYFYVLAMTYKQYDDGYEGWNKTYPNLKEFTLNDEYDQAELEDFVSRKIPFTIPANSVEPNQTIEIIVVDDNMFEPIQEGFRLLLIVNEERTPRSRVTFEGLRQLALFRIDDRQDTITFGFVEEMMTIMDVPGSHDFFLPLTIKNQGTTEINITFGFNSDGSTATKGEGEDFLDFDGGKLSILSPNVFDPQSTVHVVVNGDDLFEPEEMILVNLDRPVELMGPEPFKSAKIDSPEDSEVTLSEERVLFDLPSTTIIIQGDGILIVALTVPPTVQEGDTFFPQITVSQHLRGTFLLQAILGTATGDDFSFAIQLVEFLPTNLTLNSSSPVNTLADNLVEPDETVDIRVEAFRPEGIEDSVTFLNQQLTFTILDSNTAMIGFTVETLEFEEGVGQVDITVAVLGDALASNAVVTVRLYTETGTAEADDFGEIDMELTFTGGDQQRTVSITITDDTIFEDSEMFTANLELVDSNVNTQVSPSQLTMTIIDDDPVVLGFDSITYSASEGDGSVTVTVTVTQGIPQDGFQMQLQATAGSAEGGSDYSNVDQTFQLNSTQFTYSFTITIVNDDQVEVPEEFSISLTRVTMEGRIDINPNLATVSITDDDTLLLGFSQSSYSGSEGMSVTPRVEIKSGSLAPSLSVDVLFGNTDGTATGSADYTAVSSTLTFTSLMEGHDVPVALLSDDLFEDTESFFANLALGSTAHSVQIDVNQAELNIMDESSITFGFAADSVEVLEDAGTVTLEVSVTSGTLQRSIGFTYSTVELSLGNVATGDNDYTSTTGTLSFDSTTSTQTITISITPDTTVENNEIFQVALESTEPRVSFSSSPVTVTILNDDMATIGFEEMAYEFTEASGSGTFAVVLTGTLDISVTVLVSTTAGTATAGEDYSPIMSQSLEFSSTATRHPLTLDITADGTVEGDETLSASLTLSPSSLSSVIALDPQSTQITIVESNEVTIGFSPSTYSIMESAGQVVLTIQVLSGQLGRSVDVNMETLGHGLVGDILGSAMDLVPISQQTLTFSDNTPQMVTVTITPDMKLEMDENFVVSLSFAGTEKNVELNPSQAQITIENDDMVDIGFDQVVYVVSEDTIFVDITFSIKNNVIISSSSDPVEVQFEATPGTATDPSDYSCGSPATYTFTSTDTQFTVRCTIVDDAVSENFEMFSAVLTTSSPNTALSPASTIVEINDNDDVSFSFDRMVYMADENDVQTTITVMKEGTSDYSRSIRLRGIVENGVDITEVLVFAPGETTKTVSVPLVDDQIALEDVDQYSLSLEVPTGEIGVALGAISTATLEVADDDVLTLRLEAPLIVIESQTNFDVAIRADRDIATTLNVRVFSVLNSTAGLAQETEDYIGFDQTVTLAPGEPLDGQFFLTIVNDDRLELLNEPFQIRMELVDLPSFGMADLAVDELTVVIQDDDDLEIGFNAMTYGVGEGDGSFSFEIEVKRGSFAIPIDFIVTDAEGEALRVSDYTQVDGVTRTMQPGQTSVTYTVTVQDDDVTEVDEETFTLMLQPQTSRVSAPSSTSTVTITDNDSVRLGFSQAVYNVGENAGSVEVCVSILEGTLADDRTVTATLETEEDTATEFIDYMELNATFVLSNTKQMECFDIDISQDTLFEMAETFLILLNSTDPSAVLSPDKAVVTIQDADGVSVSFKDDEYIFQEHSGNAVIEVVLTGDTAVDVVVMVSGGPSLQMNIGSDKVAFNTMITFSDGDPKEQTASVVIHDDMIALEDDEELTVALSIVSPASGVDLGAIPSTMVKIIDNDALTVQLKSPQSRDVMEDVGTIELCVTKNLQTIVDVTLDLQYSDGTASAGSDYNPMPNTVTIPANSLNGCFSVDIVDDTLDEMDIETFSIGVTYQGTKDVSVGSPSSFEIGILDNDEPSEQVCTLSDDFILQTLSNSVVPGRSYSLSEGCERKLITTCDAAVLDLEIRADFFQNDFSSTKVSIFYEGETVVINEDFTLNPETSPNGQIVYDSAANMVSVSIPEITLIVTRNLTALSISFDNTSLPIAGLCGRTDGQLYYPNCVDIVDPAESLDSVKQLYKVKPSDQILRGERKECGITANDTVIGDPLMTVPINAPGDMSDLHLCYEIHGAADQYFNLVSDGCTSVSAHYAQVPQSAMLNIIDRMGFVAVDRQGFCHRISVDVNGCSVNVDGTDLQPVSQNQTTANFKFEQDGVSVRSYATRARISVPNCADNSLVMWVFCQRFNMEDPMTGDDIGLVNMIKFEITRGLNLKESSHGLIGQFWNIPVAVEEYSGTVKSDNSSTYPYYTVTVTHPSSDSRSFTGVLYDLTWEFESKKCLYVGNRQGGPIGEVDDPNDSVIEGSYQDYFTNGPFVTEFTYSVFKEGTC